jgi:beta-glucosidase
MTQELTPDTRPYDTPAPGPSRRSVLAGLGAGVGGALAFGSSLFTAGAATATPPRPAGRTSRSRRSRPDPRIERRVDALMRRMTFEEKVGQLQLVNTEDLAAQSLATDHPCGGVFSVVGAAKLNALQHQAVDHTRLGIPLIFGLDVIHGYTTNFPIPLGQGSSFDPSVTETDGRISAAEARRSGIHWTYAPMMDVSHEPRWGRIAEAQGEDPFLVSRFAEAKVRGFQGRTNDLSADTRLAACAKHYVAYGQPEGGRDYNTTDMSLHRLHDFYLPPFQAAVETGVATVMTSFNAINGVPAHGNVYTVREVLKGRFGFDGFVVSDFTGIQEMIVHGFVADGAGAAAAGLRAGVDMEMVSTNYVDHAAELVAQGRVTKAEIDDAVRRILRIKFALGLFEHPFADESQETTAPSAASRAAARTIAGRSMVLLQNQGSLLPLQRTGKIAVIGPLAQATFDLNGAWSGLGTGAGTTPPTSVLDAIKAAAPNATVTFAKGSDVDSEDTSGFDQAKSAAAAADVAVLVVGETAAMSGEASARSDISLPGVQEQLVSAVASSGTPVAVVLINGRPLTIASVVADAKAILEAWAPGLEGGNAVADVLFGAVNPGGKLPTTFPRAVGSVPFYYNHENTGRPADPNNKFTSKYLDLPLGPQFEYGFGLSYTTFEFSGLTLSSTRMSRRGSIRVSATVKNTGTVTGDEVVQLYIHDPVASIVQPVRRLRGFQRVTLKPGESRKVHFELGAADVGFYDNEARFVVEPGQIDVFVGNSSAATMTASFTVG